MKLPSVSATSPGRKRPHRKVLVPIGLAVVLLVVAQVVLAAPPNNVNFTTNPANPQAGQNVTFIGTAQDPDGDIASWEWDFSYDGQSFNVEATGQTSPPQQFPEGARIVALRVTDGTDPAVDPDGVANPVITQKPVNIGPPPNQAPTAQVNCPASANQGQQVTCNSNGSTDPDGQITGYTWDVDGDGFDDGTGSSVMTTFGSPGTKTIRLRVSDNDGALSEIASDTVTVNGPLTAVIQIRTLSPLPGQKLNFPLLGQANSCNPPLRPGECVEFDGTGSSDPGGSIASYLWELDIDGNGTFDTQFTSSTFRLPFPPPLHGVKTVRLTVTDADENQTSASASFRVNRRPEIPGGAGTGFIFVSPTPVINEPVRFSSQITDPDNDIVKYEWDFDGDATNGAQGFEVNAGANPNATHTFTTSGLKTVRLRATDDGGISVIDTRQVRVQASRPTGGFTWAPAAPLPGQVVAFNSTANVSAAGKQILKREWDFDWNGLNFTPDASGGSATHSFSTPGPKSVALRITEGPPGSGPDMQGELILFDTVNVNAAPRAAFTVAPASPFTGDVVTYSSTSVDPDGPLARHEWDLDGDGAYDDATGSVVSASYRRRGGYNVGLRITDSKGATATAVRRVTVRKRPLLRLSGVRVEYRVRVVRSRMRLTVLRVRAPKGSTVTIRCKGKICPKGKPVKRKGKGRKKLRVRKFERQVRPGTRIIVTVTRRGYLGEQTTIKMRRGRPPLQRDLCLVPGAKKARACPPS